MICNYLFKPPFFVANGPCNYFIKLCLTLGVHLMELS